MKMSPTTSRQALPLLSLFLLVAAVMGGCSRWTPDEAADESELAQPVSVQVATAERVTLRPSLDLVGSVMAIPERTAIISPQLGGWVNRLDVVEGQSVHADDSLVELDARSARTAVKRNQAIVGEKEAALRRLKEGYLPQEIAAARQDADRSVATSEGLRNELAALQNLLDRHEVSAVQFETKAKALKAEEATLASAQERVKLLEAGTRPELIDEAQGLLDAAKADLEQAQLELQWCTIRSPIDGIIVQLLAHQGQYFDRAVPIATVMDLSDVFVQIRIPTREFGKVQVGTRADIQLGSLPGDTFHGSVTRISGEADPLTGNVVVFVLVKNNDHVLRPGLGCQIRVWLPEVPDVLTVPTAAIADRSGTPVVTLIRDGKAFETEVALGAETREFVQVTKGLSPGDVVATAGGYGLPEGCPVQIVAELTATTTARQ